MRSLCFPMLALVIAACGDGHSHNHRDGTSEMGETNAPQTYSDGMTQTTPNGHFDVALTLSNGATTGMHDVTIELLHRDAPADADRVALDAFMPAHGHGTEPVTFTTGESTGVYAAADLNLMMAGVWELEVNVVEPDHGGIVLFVLDIE